MSKFETMVSEMLINNIDRWYDGYKKVCISYGEQTTCRYKNGGHGVVDFSVRIFIPFKKNNGITYHFEIKSSESDLNSGRGLNLFATYNYLVYPKSMITTLPRVLTYEKVDKKLKQEGCEHAGIIGVISDNDFVIERMAKRYNGDGIPSGIKAHKFNHRGF